MLPRTFDLSLDNGGGQRHSVSGSKFVLVRKVDEACTLVADNGAASISLEAGEKARLVPCGQWDTIHVENAAGAAGAELELLVGNVDADFRTAASSSTARLAALIAPVMQRTPGVFVDVLRGVDVTAGLKTAGNQQDYSGYLDPSGVGISHPLDAWGHLLSALAGTTANSWRGVHFQDYAIPVAAHLIETAGAPSDIWELEADVKGEFDANMSTAVAALVFGIGEAAGYNRYHGALFQAAPDGDNWRAVVRVPRGGVDDTLVNVDTGVPFAAVHRLKIRCEGREVKWLADDVQVASVTAAEVTAAGGWDWLGSTTDNATAPLVLAARDTNNSIDYAALWAGLAGGYRIRHEEAA